FYFQQVPPCNDVLEHAPCFIADLRNLTSVVTRAEVRSDQSLDSGFFCNASGILHGGMLALASHLDSVGAEGGLVDQRRAFVSQLNRAFGKLRIKAVHDALTWTGFAENHVGSNHAAVFQSDGFTVLKLPV